MRQKRDNVGVIEASGTLVQPGFGMATDAHVIEASRSPHKDKPRGHWRESQYAQVAMLTIHRGVPPPNVEPH